MLTILISSLNIVKNNFSIVLLYMMLAFSAQSMNDTITYDGKIIIVHSPEALYNAIARLSYSSKEKWPAITTAFKAAFDEEKKFSFIDKFGDNVLHHAAWKGYVNAVELIIYMANRMDNTGSLLHELFFAPDHHKDSPLHVALNRGYLNVAKVIINAAHSFFNEELLKEFLVLPGNQNSTFMHISCRGKYVEEAEILEMLLNVANSLRDKNTLYKMIMSEDDFEAIPFQRAYGYYTDIKLRQIMRKYAAYTGNQHEILAKFNFIEKELLRISPWLPE